MPFLTPYQYYTNGTGSYDSTNWGSYQYVPLVDLVNNFMMMYVGNDKMLNNVKRHEVIFHTKQAIKQLNYDALRNIKHLELAVGDDLKFVLPHDYVNYVRISLNVKGLLMPLTENMKANTATRYLQDANEHILFDIQGNLQIIDSTLDLERITPTQYTGPGPYYGYTGYYIDGDWYFSFKVGGRYGMSPDAANVNPKFMINNGVIDFSSGMSGQIVVLEYISDGMSGNDADITVNKFAEEFIYRYVKWAIMNNKIGFTLYDKKLAKDEKVAELRNAKLRLSNIHPGRLLMSLRGQIKWIK